MPLSMLPNQGGVFTSADVDTINRNVTLLNNAPQTLTNLVRRGQAYAAMVNPYNVAPYNSPAAWVTATPYTIGQVVTSDTSPVKMYLCVTAATSGASAPTGTSVTSVSDGAAAWVYIGPTVTGTGPTCTVTEPGNTTGLTKEYRYVLTPNSFFLRGGMAANAFSTFYGINTQTVLGDGNISGHANQTAVAWCFNSSAPKLCLRCSGTTAYRIVVDGKFITISGEIPGGFTTLDWGGYRKMRHYEVQVSQNYSLSSVFVDANSEVTFPAYSNPITAMFIGDSITTGALWGVAMPDTDIASIISRTMGFTNWSNQGQGGSGYNATNGGLVYTFNQRPNTNYALVNPDLVVIFGGQNDTVPTLQSDVTQYLNKLRTLLPTQPFVVLGRWPAPGSGGSTDSTILASEAAISAGVQQWNDTNKLFIPIVGAPGGSWFTGTGNVSSISAGNTSSYVQSDGTHQTPNGSFVLADFICQALRSTASQALM